MNKKSFMALFLAITVIVSAFIKSDYVKADTIAQATAVVAGQEYSGSVTQGNYKYYKFFIDNGGILTFNTESFGDLVEVDIYDRMGEDYLAGFSTDYNSNIGHYRDVGRKVYLQAGTYYIRVSAISDKNVSYKFKFTYASSKETYPENARKDDTKANANSFTLGKLTYGMVCEYPEAYCDTTDVYKFTLRYKQQVSMELWGYAGDGYVYFKIQDANSKTYSESDAATTWSGVSEKRKVTLGKGTYYLIIKGDQYTKYKFRLSTCSVLSKNENGLKYTTFNQKSGWYYLKNGFVNTNATGITKYNGTYYYVKNGRLTFDVNGLVKGKINGKNGYWYCKDSKICFDTTLVKYKGKYYGVFNGFYDSKKSGIVKYNKAYWYVKNGKLASTYTGNVTIGGKTYKIVKGKVQK